MKWKVFVAFELWSETIHIPLRAEYDTKAEATGYAALYRYQYIHWCDGQPVVSPTQDSDNHQLITAVWIAQEIT